MPEFAFLDHHNRQLRSTYGGGDGGRGVGLDSVIYSAESSLSLFSSSTSAYTTSIERCSSASGVLDHDSFVSDMPLPGGFRGSCSARSSDPDPNKNSTVRNNEGPYLIGKKVEKAQAIKEYIDAETDGEIQSLYSARSSISHTTKEYKNRKSRSEILLRKSDRRRPASLDLNNQAMNVSNSSPRLESAMKSSVSAQRSSVFPSPGTPNYRTTTGIQKFWSSERVPSNSKANRIQGSFTSLPYNNGRTLPSKWEDAERWIISPVAPTSSIQQPQRRPKAKSGPLGPTGPTYYSMYSPSKPSFTNESTLTAENNNSSIQYKDGLERSLSVHVNHHTDDKIGDLNLNISRDASRRDMATQMSPESSTYSSRRNSNSVADSQHVHVHSSKSEIRDVEVDGQVTLTRWSKKSKTRFPIPGRWSDILDAARSADWEASEMTKSLSKVKREEAKITAWENLQKAKAEASIRKLEMKLEKKRSSSMDRIMKKLRIAQKKAQEMRESQSYNKVAKSSHKAMSLIKTRHLVAFSGCFTCPAF
ncbi:hypothetical protein LXL04_031689 [Taraxacum kok-saghyz]